MTPPRPSPVTCLIPFITYGFVPAIQNERALAFVGIQLILCRYKSCSYNCTSSLVKPEIIYRIIKYMISGKAHALAEIIYRSLVPSLYPVRYRLGMMLRTYRGCAKVVTSFELQNTPIGGGHKLLYD